MIPKNKFKLTDPITLSRAEEELAKRKAKRLFDSGDINNIKVGTYAGLSSIHKYLFEDMYEFAGKPREYDISKGNFQFASVMYLTNSLERVSSMAQGNYDEIIEKYVEMNVAHPFCDGNGRATRIWLNLILKQEIKQIIDWNKITKADYFKAMELSVVDDATIKSLLKPHLTDDTNNRDLYLKNIDVSFLYEGFSDFKAEDI